MSWYHPIKGDCHMKKSFILFCLIFCFTNDASGKVIYPISQPEPVKINACYDKSNIDYNQCLRTCISPMSPAEIIDLCWRQCARKVNNEFFNCLLPRK